MIRKIVVRIIIYLCSLVLSAPVLFAAEGALAPVSQKDKESYSIGYQVGRSMKADGVVVSVERFNEGLQDAVNEKEPRLSTEEMRKLIVDLRKKSREVKMAMAQNTSTAEQSRPQTVQTRSVSQPNLTITGKIVKDDQNYIIQGEKPLELFTVLNPNPSVLDILVKNAETVTIEAISVMGDNVEIRKINGKSYKEAK
jgi:hypothetical protein